MWLPQIVALNYHSYSPGRIFVNFATILVNQDTMQTEIRLTVIVFFRLDIKHNIQYLVAFKGKRI